MIKAEGKLVFVNVDTNYLETLHNNDNEVQYSSSGYEDKPFVGILIANEQYKYVVPLSSAKSKHVKWRDTYSDGRFLITDIIDRSAIKPDTIYKEHDEDHVKRIYAVTDVKKMIPVKEGVYSVVDLTYGEDEAKSAYDYKILQNKEYGACVKIFARIAKKADAIYSKQKATGKVQRFACNYAKLEEVCDNYKVD